MGGQMNCADVKDVPLWYSNADHPVADYSDWIAFGGWTHAAFKQYQFNSAETCNFNIDRNIMLNNE